jgi:hypothetical protein
VKEEMYAEFEADHEEWREKHRDELREHARLEAEAEKARYVILSVTLPLYHISYYGLFVAVSTLFSVYNFVQAIFVQVRLLIFEVGNSVAQKMWSYIS